MKPPVYERKESKFKLHDINSIEMCKNFSGIVWELFLPKNTTTAPPKHAWLILYSVYFLKRDVGGRGCAHLTSESAISLCPISPTCVHLNFFRRATRALLHAASDGIVLKNKGYLLFFVKVGDVDPNDTCAKKVKKVLPLSISFLAVNYLHAKCNLGNNKFMWNGDTISW